MRREACDRDAVREHLAAVRGALADPRLAGALRRAAARVPGPGAPQEKVAALLSPDIEALASSGGGPPGLPYLSRAPLVSLVQSHLERALSEAGVPDPDEHAGGFVPRLVQDVERILHRAPGSFTTDDPDWYVKITEAVLERFAEGTVPFNPAPAEYDGLADDARLVVVGDWGTGLPRARDVAARMGERISEALAGGRQVHVIHLGDVYYSGLVPEDQQRFLDLWPVTGQQARAGVTSWSLNGNHDMYGGGHGYFGTLLADPRFAHQRSADGRATSYFRLRSPSWDFVGLDTAWDDDPVSAGQIGGLTGQQGEYVAQVAAASARKLVLFSHHQLVSYYDQHDLGPVLPGRLAPVLRDGRVLAWWWGHEHRAITYAAARGVAYPRCLGNGSVPVLPDPDPPPGSEPAITWHSTRSVREDGQRRTRFGFAVLDLSPEAIRVAYVDDDGHVPHTESISS